MNSSDNIKLTAVNELHYIKNPSQEIQLKAVKINDATKSNWKWEKLSQTSNINWDISKK
jgi:hypothetical protein